MIPLPVDPHWRCQGSGDCCRLPEAVTMTEDEANLLVAWAQEHWTMRQLGTLEFSPVPGSSFVNLHARPCPFYDTKDRTCTVYPIRPFNCRRFACMRPDVVHERLDLKPAAPLDVFREIGCANLRTRLVQSRAARRLYTRIHTKAQRWAAKHGWKDAT